MSTLASPTAMVSPKPILSLIGALQTAKYVFVADEIDLFEHLRSQPLPLDELADRIGYPPRTARILADALVATDFLTKDEQGYHNSPMANAFLSGTSAADLRPMLRLWKHLVHQKWQELEEGLRLDKATLAFGTLSAEDRQLFSHGVASLTASTANRLAVTYDFTPHQRVLDLWGGMGDFLAAALQANPNIKVTLFELPATAALAREHWAVKKQTPIDILEGNIFADRLPLGYDAILLANIVHLSGPERNQDLFRRIRQAVEPGARFLLIDFWTDPSRTQPVFAALMAGEFQVFAGEGDVYSRQQIEEWLRETGWEVVDFKPLTEAASLIVAEAR